MAVSIATPGPYAPGSGLISVITRFRNRGLSVPITKDVLMRAGVTDSLVPRTLQSLQTLDLIDDAGQPTPTLLKLRSVPEADYKATLTEWLQSAYAEVFRFTDPRHDDAIRVRDAFRAYTPHGQQDRMVSLFMALCTEAGIVDASTSDAKPARKTARAPALPSQRNKAPAQRNPPTPPPGTTNAPPGLAPAITGMLASIPTGGKGWTKEDRDRFVATFAAVLDFAIPVVTAESLIEQDEEEVP